MAAGDPVHPKVAAATVGGTASFSLGYAIVSFLGTLPTFQHMPDSARDALAGIVIAAVTAAGTWFSGFMRSKTPGLSSELDRAITAAGAKLGLSAAQIDHVKQVAETDVQSAMDRLADYAQQVTAAPPPSAIPDQTKVPDEIMDESKIPDQTPVPDEASA